MFRADLDREVSAVTEGRQVCGLSSVDAGRSFDVGKLASFHEPGDVCTIALRGNDEPQRLTSVNGDRLNGKTLGAQKKIWYEAEDTNRARGCVIKSPDAATLAMRNSGEARQGLNARPPLRPSPAKRERRTSRACRRFRERRE